MFEMYQSGEMQELIDSVEVWLDFKIKAKYKRKIGWRIHFNIFWKSKIKKSNYKFPELFYNIDLDPKQKEIVISFDLKKTEQKCDECYLKIFSRDKNLSISQRNIQIENLSGENYNGISKIKIREKNIAEQIKFTVRFHDENTNDYFDKDIEINKRNANRKININNQTSL